MELKIYHGSEGVVIPEYGKGKLYNDYGRGYYCTENLELAKEWACAHGSDGYVNEYKFTLDGLKVLNLNSERYGILNWLAILLDNRKFVANAPLAEESKRYLLENFLPEYRGYDVIKGYRADDSYFSFANDFISGSLSLRDLKVAMELGSLGEQVVLKSERAFSQIEWMEAGFVSADEYFVKYSNRDMEARRKYGEIRGHLFDTNELYVLDIIRQGIKDGDPRL